APLQHVGDHLANRLRRVAALTQPDFRRLDVPVGDLAPEVIRNVPTSLTVEMSIEQPGHVLCEPVEPADDPTVDDLQLAARSSRTAGVHLDLVLLHAPEREARHVPQLVAEIAARLHLLLAEATVVA